MWVRPQRSLDLDDSGGKLVFRVFGGFNSFILT